MENNKIWSIENQICEEFLDQGKDIPDGQIVKYLKECFPDSCFARNYTQYSALSCDEPVVELYNYFRYEVLNWCGCGQPEEADKQVVKYLNLVDIPWRDEEDVGFDERLASFDSKYKAYQELCKEYFGCETIYDNPLLLCLAYTMDAAEFTEHGSGIGGAWIEPKGKIFRYAIQKHLELKCEEI